MLSVAVYSSHEQGVIIEDFVRKYSMQKNIELTVELFEQYETLLDMYYESLFDLIFLNIDYQKDYIKQIINKREKFLSRRTYLILMSNLNTVSGELFKLYPLGYIFLPTNYSEIEKYLDLYTKTICSNNDLFVLKKDHTDYIINVSSILYMESISKKVIIHTKTEHFECYGKLSDYINESCFRDFVEVHRSFIVNSNYIEKITNGYVVLTGQIYIPISRSKKKNVLEWVNKLNRL